MNKTINSITNFDVKVTGVYEDLPDNTSFHEVKIIMPWDLWLIQNPWAKQMQNPWGEQFFSNICTGHDNADNADMQKVSARIKM